MIWGTVPRSPNSNLENAHGIGARLEAKIQEAHPGFTIYAAVELLAGAAGVSPSQINRIRSGETRKPHSSTLSKLAENLSTTAQWLRYGIDTVQTDAFAVAFPTKEEAGNADPTLQVSATIDRLRRYPRELQVRACRAAVASMLDIVASAGLLMPEGYQSLVFLDGMQSTTVGLVTKQADEVL